MNTKGGVLFSHRHRTREAVILLEGALAISLEHDLNSAALRAYNNLGAFLWVLGQFRAALENGDRALELARRVGDRRWESTFLAGPAGFLMMLGRWDDALARGSEAEGATEFVRSLLLHLAPIHLHRGDLDGVRRLLSESESSAHSENASWVAVYALTEAMLYRAEGRGDETLAAVDRALGVRETASGSQAMIRFDALEIAADFVGEEKLRELIAVVDEFHPGEQGAFLRAQKARFRARLPEHETEAELAAAEQLFEEAEMPFYAAVTRLERAENLLADGRADEAGPLVAAARETFEELRARPWVERAEALALGAKVPA